MKIQVLIIGIVGALTEIHAFISKTSNCHDLKVSEKTNFSTLLKRKPFSPLQMSHPNNNKIERQRRQFFKDLLLTSTSAATILSTSSVASAYNERFPDALDFTRMDEIDRQQYKKNQIMSQNKVRSKNDFKIDKNDIAPSITWAAASWLLLGSRSNPLVTPLANVFYDSNDDSDNQWLIDRNQGLFASVPLPLYVVLSGMFLLIGFLIHILILALEGGLGDVDVSLNLAGVSLIGGASLELGRIASGEKAVTKEENDRTLLLQKEFDEFAEKRLLIAPRGNCHKSEVIRAFRRFYGKYRVAENPQNPEYDVADLEIERLLKSWNREAGNQEMSSVGFITGVEMNDQSDVLLL